MTANRLIFRIHAIRRMFERQISVNDVREALANGEAVEDYPDDFPYPSRLVLGWHGTRPIHIVAADNPSAHETIIITVYEPDHNEWEIDFKVRK